MVLGLDCANLTVLCLLDLVRQLCYIVFQSVLTFLGLFERRCKLVSDFHIRINNDQLFVSTRSLLPNESFP
jgi:hypothetical protein